MLLDVTSLCRLEYSHSGKIHSFSYFFPAPFSCKYRKRKALAQYFISLYLPPAEATKRDVRSSLLEITILPYKGRKLIKLRLTLTDVCNRLQRDRFQRDVLIETDLLMLAE